MVSSGATRTCVRGAKFNFDGLREGEQGGLPPWRNFYEKIGLFLGFEVKKQHFLIVEGLALCSIKYQILIITIFCSCV